jgi:hypothetical protein
MIKLRTSRLLIGLLFICNILSSKDFPKINDVPVPLAKNDQRKIDHANEMIKEARDLWKQLNQTYNPDSVTTYKVDSINNAEGTPILNKLAKLFLEANSQKFEIYLGMCNEFWEKHKYDRPVGLEAAKKLQKEAQQYFDSAQLNRRAASDYAAEYAKAYDRYYEAISLEIIACKKEARALQTYRDWPIHYSYEWDDDIEVNLFNPVRPEIKKEEPHPVEKPKEVVKEVPKELPDSMIIFYKVQIAAHTIRLTDKYIKANIYAGNMKVEELTEDGWYKYTIGKFKTEEEANKLLNQIQVAKAFVAAYKNGKRVPLKEVEQIQNK